MEDKNDQQNKQSKLSKKSILSSLIVRPLNPQEVRLSPAPVWSKALAWTIIGTASFGFCFAVFANTAKQNPKEAVPIIVHANALLQTGAGLKRTSWGFSGRTMRLERMLFLESFDCLFC